MLILCLFLAVLWIWLAFGSVLPSGSPAYWLPVMLLIGWPAGLAGTSGQIGHAIGNGLSPALRWYHSLGQHLPFLALAVGIWPFAGWPGLVTSLLLLVVNFWSVSLGKAAVLLTCRPGVGSVFQAFGWLTAILLPPIVRGF